MPNKYGSKENTVMARTLFQSAALAAPADLTFDFSTGLLSPDVPFQAIYQRAWYDPNLTINIKQAGIFCNFADGLVFKNPDIEFHLTLVPYATALVVDYSGYTGQITLTEGSNQATVADSTEFSTNDIISSLGGINPLLVSSIVDGTTIGFTTPSRIGGTFDYGTAIEVNTYVRSADFYFDIPSLNALYTYDRHITINDIVVPSDFGYDRLWLFGHAFAHNYIAQNNVLTLMTKTINTTFNGEKCVFDGVIVLEN